MLWIFLINDSEKYNFDFLKKVKRYLKQTMNSHLVKEFIVFRCYSNWNNLLNSKFENYVYEWVAVQKPCEFSPIFSWI